MPARGEKTRQHIIDKATVLFTQNGFKPTSLSQILNATGLAKGGFYFHFKSKEALGMAVIESLENCWTEKILPQMAEGRNAKEKLRIIFSSPGDCCNSPDQMRPTILLLNLATEMSEVNEIFSSKLQRIFEGWRLVFEAIIEEGKLENIFKKGIDSTAVANIILSNILGANLLALLNAREDIYYQQLATFKDILFAGIST